MWLMNMFLNFDITVKMHIYKKTNILVVKKR